MNGRKLSELDGSSSEFENDSTSLYEELVQNKLTAPFVFLATHELELTKLADRHLNVSK